MQTDKPLLSVVLPTYNEAGNIAVIVERLSGVLAATPHEIIVADDDSPDLTWKKVQELCARIPHLKVIRRTADRGLYPAVMEGFANASGKYLAVMDADLQHDEKILPRMLELAQNGAQLVVASRYTGGGGTAGWSGTRLLASRLANKSASLLLKRRCTDLMSGFFLVERAAFEQAKPKLHPRGFKIFMDVLQNLPDGARVAEAGYVFRPRTAGESKLSLKVTLEAAAGLYELSLGRYVPLKALLFALGLLAAAAAALLFTAGL
ncbi:MAG: polyprenol monophosphomannose synthase [Elusimicrobiales bacterium]|nr:polyprenol monophosphomannose synthase [Elusimicrobiales bacterium]